jgi:hypothetical protein
MIRRYRDLRVTTRYEVKWATKHSSTFKEPFSDVLSAHDRVRALIERETTSFVILSHITESHWVSRESAG